MRTMTNAAVMMMHLMIGDDDGDVHDEDDDVPDEDDDDVHDDDDDYDGV